MRKQDWPFISGIILGLGLAIGCGAYLISGGVLVVSAVALAFAAFAFSQIILLMLVARKASTSEELNKETHSNFETVWRQQNESKRLGESSKHQIDAIKSEIHRDRETYAKGFSELKDSYESLLTHMQRAAEFQPAPDQFYAPPRPSIAPEMPEEDLRQPNTENEVASPFGDQLSVSLEPIVDLSSGRTAHYRMHLALATEQGDELTSELFLHHADRIGARPALDAYVAREAELLLRKLRMRDSQLSIFMPIGAATLASRETIAKILTDRKAAPDVAQGLVFDVPHAMLAGLTEQGLEGLAMLARQGARFALSNISIAGLDLAAMNTLNVRYIGLDAAAIDVANGPSTAMASFNQAARASRVQMIVTGVADPRLIGKLSQITRLVSGPCFAPPRRVKKDSTETANFGFHAAA